MRRATICWARCARPGWRLCEKRGGRGEPRHLRAARLHAAATDGTLVTAGDGVSLMLNGKLVRIGNTKVLFVGTEGNLLLRVGLQTVDLGKPDKWGRFSGAGLSAGGFVRMGNTV